MRVGVRAPALLTLMAACVMPAPAPVPCPDVRADHSSFVAPSATTELDLGLVVYDLGVAETAQVFHIADQLSEWNPFSHKHYARWIEKEHPLGPLETSAPGARAHPYSREGACW